MLLRTKGSSSILRNLAINPVSQLSNLCVYPVHPVLQPNKSWSSLYISIYVIVFHTPCTSHPAPNLNCDRVYLLSLVIIYHHHDHWPSLPPRSHLPSWPLQQDRADLCHCSSPWKVHRCHPDQNFRLKARKNQNRNIVSRRCALCIGKCVFAWQLSLPLAPAQTISSEIRPEFLDYLWLIYFILWWRVTSGISMKILEWQKAYVAEKMHVKQTTCKAWHNIRLFYRTRVRSYWLPLSFTD